MSTVSAVLITIAKELAKEAQNNLPNIQEGERIQKEWLKDGVYYRESSLNGVTYTREYDFKHKNSRNSADTCNKDVRDN